MNEKTQSGVGILREYQLYINLVLVLTTDDKKEVWDMIGSRPFGSLYEVVGDDVEEFLPF